MDTNAITKTASRVGLSDTTVAAVVETYEGLTVPAIEYKCPWDERPYKTASGLKGHISKNHKGKK